MRCLKREVYSVGSIQNRYQDESRSCAEGFIESVPDHDVVLGSWRNDRFACDALKTKMQCHNVADSKLGQGMKHPWQLRLRYMNDR